MVYLTSNCFFQSSVPDSELIVERSCERRSDVLPKNISYPEFIELRINMEKLYSNHLNAEFGRKFGLNSPNLKELKETLYHMERKGEYSIEMLRNIVSVLFSRIGID